MEAKIGCRDEQSMISSNLEVNPKLKRALPLKFGIPKRKWIIFPRAVESLFVF